MVKIIPAKMDGKRNLSEMKGNTCMKYDNLQAVFTFQEREKHYIAKD